jgi:DNA-binding response OmpR family regulator
MNAPGILLIEGEDEGLVERVLRRYRIDNRLERFADRERAISLLRSGFSEQVQLLILDYSVGKAQSRETVVRIRGLPGLDQLPVILACGSPEEETAVRAWNAGRIACMSKPAGFFKLLECIQKLEMHWNVFASKTG